MGKGWSAGPIMVVIGSGGLIAAVFVVVFRAWFVRLKVGWPAVDAFRKSAATDLKVGDGSSVGAGILAAAALRRERPG